MKTLTEQYHELETRVFDTYNKLVENTEYDLLKPIILRDYDSTAQEIIKEIAKVGLARYYKPMPTELEGTTAHPRVGDTVTQEVFDELKDKYGHADWYSWSNANWGTKWGCYDNQLDDTIYRFTTAWSPLDSELLELFAKDFPNFTYEWEEEQGYGLNAECEDGEISIQEEWDIPSVEEVYDENDEELDIYFLSEEHRGKEVGYYDSWSLEEYLGATKEEALQNI